MAHPMQHYGDRDKKPRGRQPSEQWWTINGQVMLDAMYRCHAGEDPEIMYMELIANSDTTEVESE